MKIILNFLRNNQSHFNSYLTSEGLAYLDGTISDENAVLIKKDNYDELIRLKRLYHHSEGTMESLREMIEKALIKHTLT